MLAKFTLRESAFAIGEILHASLGVGVDHEPAAIPAVAVGVVHAPAERVSEQRESAEEQDAPQEAMREIARDTLRKIVAFLLFGSHRKSLTTAQSQRGPASQV